MLIKNKCCLAGFSWRETVWYCRFPQHAMCALLKSQSHQVLVWLDRGAQNRPEMFYIYASLLCTRVLGGRRLNSGTTTIKEEPHRWMKRFCTCELAESGDLGVLTGHLSRPSGRQMMMLLSVFPCLHFCGCFCLEVVRSISRKDGSLLWDKPHLHEKLHVDYKHCLGGYLQKQ